MSTKTIPVHVLFVNEGEHQPSEERYDAISLQVDTEGTLRIETPTGSSVHGRTTWGSFTVTRVAER